MYNVQWLAQLTQIRHFTPYQYTYHTLFFYIHNQSSLLYFHCTYRLGRHIVFALLGDFHCLHCCHCLVVEPLLQWFWMSWLASCDSPWVFWPTAKWRLTDWYLFVTSLYNNLALMAARSKMLQNICIGHQREPAFVEYRCVIWSKTSTSYLGEL